MTWKGWENFNPPMSREQFDGLAAAVKAHEAVPTPAKRGKYGAVKTTVDNIVFDSKKEAARYQALKLLEAGGAIRRLVLQPEFTLNAWSGDHAECPQVGVYRADFAYEQWSVDRWVKHVEDVKGMKTPLYRWKKKHVQAQYGITIRET